MADIREKISGITGDIREGLKIMDRYVLKRDIRSRTVLEDRENGVALFDSEDEHSKEYPIVKVLAVAVAAVVGLSIFFIGMRRNAGRKKIIKHQKKEIKRLRKLCKEAKIEYKVKKKKVGK